MSRHTEHEQTLNVFMAKLLAANGLDAKPEAQRVAPDGKPGPRDRIDIQVRIGPAVVAIEAKQGQGPEQRRAAVEAADERVRMGYADCGVALCYPDDSTEDSLPDAEFVWCVRGGVLQDARWDSGNLEQLTSVVRLTPAQVGNPDYAAAALSVSLDAAVERLSDLQKQDLARGMNLPPGKRGKSSADVWDRPAKRALLVVATAVMFHARLDEHAAEIKPSHDSRYGGSAKFEGTWPPKRAHICEQSDDPIGDFRDAWNLYLAADYTPIFRTARAALNACTPSPAFAEAVRITARAALVVVQNIAGMRHDLLGRVFHTVLDSARYDGSFYTTTAAATLLAALAIKEDLCDWADPESVASLQITDPACGTGTLLMAAAERIRELSISANGSEPDDVARILIEDVLTGFDINLTATHMAATTLGLLSPTTQFNRMKIGQTFLGVDDEDDKAYLGSLEFLDMQPKLMPWPNGNGNGRPKQVESQQEFATVAPSDLVIMNPPFTRDSLRHNQFSAEHERRIKQREKEIFARTPVHLSGNSGAFMYLADFLCKPDAGTVAFVSPLVNATNISALPMRQHLARSFHIETIVTSHDPSRIYFSENTRIGEILIVCRRAPFDSRGPTRIINLASNPRNPSDAMSTYFAIRDGSLQERGLGTEQHWPASRIAAGDWGAVQWLSPFLSGSYQQLKGGELFPVMKLGDVAEIGPAGQAVRETFARSKLPTAEGMRALWDHKTDVTRSMSATTDTAIAPRPGQADRARVYWSRRGRLMLPTRAFLRTTRTMAVVLDSAALGSAWVPCRVVDANVEPDAMEKAMAVYVNSSVGLLSILGDRSNRKPTYPNFSIADLNGLVVPRALAESEETVAQLSAAFDTFHDGILEPLPAMMSCTTRLELDKAVGDAVGLSNDTVSAIRRDIAAEPSVTGNRFEG